MELRATLLVRCLRAGLLAVIILAAGALAHVSAGGSMPGRGAMLTLCAVAAAACAAVLGREASARRLVALTVGGQLAVHGVLSELGGHGAAAPVAQMSAGAHAGMVHDGASSSMPAMAAFSMPPTWLPSGIGDLLANPLMSLFHVAAAAAVGLWLSVGERALWSIVRLARCTARGVLAHAATALDLPTLIVRAVRRAVGVRPAPVDPLPLLPVWSRGPARRGPPAVALLPH